LGPTVEGENAFASCNDVVATSVALEVPVVDPAFVDVSDPAASVFTRFPLVVGVTVTCTVQEPFAGMVAPLTETLPAPGLAVTEAPVQLVDVAGGAAFCRPAG
jgi:hypothetical protein